MTFRAFWKYVDYNISFFFDFFNRTDNPLIDFLVIFYWRLLDKMRIRDYIYYHDKPVYQ